VTLRRNASSRIFSADIRDRAVGRVHVTLATTVKTEALERYAAIVALVREGDAALLADLRGRRLNIEAVARCYRERKPFSALRQAEGWPTLGTAVEKYAAWTKARHSAGTAKQVGYNLGAAVAHFGAARSVAVITPADVAGYRTTLEAAGLNPGTVRGKLCRMAALFRWLAREENRAARAAHRPPRTLDCPIELEAVPAAPAARTRFLSAEEITNVVAATPAQYAALVGLGLLAGLRIAEALHLRAGQDVDLEHAVLHIRAHSGWRPKTKSSARSVPIADPLLPLLAAQVQAVGRTGWLFPNTRGTGPISDDMAAQHLRRIIEDAELVYGQDSPLGVTYHTLRHTFASNLVMAGVDLFTVARLLGHAKTDEIEQVYGHLAPEHRQAALRRLGDRLAPAYRPRLVAERPA